MENTKNILKRMKNINFCHEVLVEVFESLCGSGEFIANRANSDGYWIKSTKTGISYTINFWAKQYESDNPDAVGISCSMDAYQNRVNLKVNINLVDDVFKWIDEQEESGENNWNLEK